MKPQRHLLSTASWLDELATYVQDERYRLIMLDQNPNSIMFGDTEQLSRALQNAADHVLASAQLLARRARPSDYDSLSREDRRRLRLDAKADERAWQRSLNRSAS